MAFELDVTDTPTDPPAAPGRGLAALAGQLMRLAREDPGSLSARVAELSVAEQAELALRLPARQRLELLLHAPRPMRLVRALPDSELYLTAREVGPADALPLLGLASASQIHHLLDLEAWRRDRFDVDRAGGWVALLLEAGEPALRRFLRTADDELLVLLLGKWIRVEQIEYEDSAEVHGHGESEAGTERGFLTPDGYHRFSPTIPEHAPAIRRMLQLFFEDQPARYARVLWLTLWELPSEIEEQAYRWRQSRLEEHGFPPWEEALDVYAPPRGDTRRPQVPRPSDPDGLPAARSPLRLRGGHGELVHAIDSLPDALRERVLFELVSLANHLLVADGADTGDPALHAEALEGALGGVEIGLHERGSPHRREMARALAETPVLELFREGWAHAVTLQQRARHWFETGWPAGDLEALRRLDSPLGERLAGLLEVRPRYAEIVAGRVRLRPFHSHGELDASAVALELALLLQRVFVDRLGVDVRRISMQAHESPAQLSTLVVTLLAWHATRNELRVAPLPREVAADFLRNVASRRTAAPDAPQRAWERLLRALTEEVELSSREISGLQSFGRFCLERLAEEWGTCDPGVPPDAARAGSLLLEP